MNKDTSELPAVIKSVQTVRLGPPDPGKIRLYEVDWGLMQESEYTSGQVLGTVSVGDAVTDLPSHAHVSKSGNTAKFRHGAGAPLTPSLNDSTPAPSTVQAAAFRLRKVALSENGKITAEDVIRVWRRIE